MLIASRCTPNMTADTIIETEALAMTMEESAVQQQMEAINTAKQAYLSRAMKQEAALIMS